MNPIYRFILATDDDAQVAFPIYNDSLSLDYALEQAEQFYRGHLTGDLTFLADDYLFIVGKPFDTAFRIEIQISRNDGNSWATYWKGKFWKTDCTFDADTRTVQVTPTLSDRYDKVLDGMDKEYDLITLAPALAEVKIDKRPMVQVYVAGQSVIGCYLSGMWWEQECEAVSDLQDLQTIYHFAINKRQRIVDISGEFTPELPPLFMGTAPTATAPAFSYSQDGYAVSLSYNSVNYTLTFRITRESDGVVLWQRIRSGTPPTAPYTETLGAVAGSGATGTVTISVRDIVVLARYITNVENYGGLQTSPLPEDDLVPDNRNYSRVIQYSFPDNIFFSQELTSTPTRWGLFQPGEYYANPVAPSLGIPEVYPVGRSEWTRVSIWFASSWFADSLESRWREEITLKDAYPLWSVISVLLAQFAPDITHAEDSAYSQFLYGATNPIKGGVAQRLYITPKSNLINASYDQPAQTAPVTLRQILDMLRDCYRVYWFIDEDNRFRLEHISWFMRGGSYSGTPSIGIDLTREIITRNGKAWSYARNQYTFEKPDMPSRYQFSWMDEVTLLFKGYPIEILSGYVQGELIEDVSISQFTSDVDYILLNPSEIARDGFILLSLDAGTDKLPYVQYTVNDVDYELQNGKASFQYLQEYYLYDLPARRYSINGVQGGAYGTKRLKTQTLTFPVEFEPDFMELVKTDLGSGKIEKMVITLLSRNANTTLHYDTE